MLTAHIYASKIKTKEVTDIVMAEITTVVKNSEQLFYTEADVKDIAYYITQHPDIVEVVRESYYSQEVLSERMSKDELILAHAARNLIPERELAGLRPLVNNSRSSSRRGYDSIAKQYGVPVENSQLMTLLEMYNAMGISYGDTYCFDDVKSVCREIIYNHVMKYKDINYNFIMEKILLGLFLPLLEARVEGRLGNHMAANLFLSRGLDTEEQVELIWKDIKCYWKTK